MRIISTIEEMRSFSEDVREKGKTIGFVPTMGYLHEGHLSLVHAAVKECDTVVVSIYVNPTQFGEAEDLVSYPRDIERDKSLAEEAGADVVFTPTSSQMYPSGWATTVEVSGELTSRLCGRSRPGHFKGVTTIVSKLFNIVEPSKAYFGQKDAQQCIVIDRMVKDLNMLVEIRTMPIIREDDGLAMSSRNTYLSPGERGQALALFKALKRAEELTSSGERNSSRILSEVEKIVSAGPDVKIDYVAIVDAQTLKSVDNIEGRTLIAIAAFVGKTRLIDNITVNG